MSEFLVGFREVRGVTACFKGGGGGSSGKVDYPTYMKNIHADWLSQTDKDFGGTPDMIESSMTDVMNTALGGSPFADAVAYDPDDDLASSALAVSSLQALDPMTTLSAALTQMTTMIRTVEEEVEESEEERITASINSFTALLDAKIESTVLPRFERGMQDINSVMSSAFVVGRALIEEGRNHDVAKFSSDVWLDAHRRRTDVIGHTATFMVQVLQNKTEWLKACATMAIESNRIKIVAKKEEVEHNLHIDERDAKWDLEVFQHGANLLAAIGGGAVSTQAPGQNKFMSALGGALSGAGAGMMTGNPMMGLLGGLFGGIAGLFG